MYTVGNFFPEHIVVYLLAGLRKKTTRPIVTKFREKMAHGLRK